MTLDIRTLLVIISLSSFFQALALGFQSRICRNFRGIGWWALGNVFAAVGFGCYMLRDIIPFTFVTVIFGNLATFLGGILIYTGILRFFGKKENRIILVSAIAVFLLGNLYFTYVTDDVSARIIIYSVAMLCILFISAGSMLANKVRSIELSVNILAAIFILNGSFLALRTLMTLISVTASNFFSPTAILTILFMNYLVFGFLSTMGAIIMVNQRLTAEVSEAKEHFELIFNASPDATIISRLKDGHVIEMNEGFTVLLGYAKDDVIGKTIFDIEIWEDPASRENIVKELAEKGFCDKVETAFVKKDGSRIDGIFSAKQITIQGVPHMISVTHDITKRKQMEKLVFDEKELMKTTLMSIGDGVISTDREGKIGLVNKVAGQLTGWSQEEAFGKPLEDVYNVVDELTGEKCVNPVHITLRTGNVQKMDRSTILISKEGLGRYVEDIAAPIKNEEGEISGAVLIFRDYTDKKHRIEKIEYLSYHDQLTGLYNRRFYKEEIKRLDTEQNLPLTLVMADINGLKLANDAFGHVVGDQLIMKTAEILTREFRSEDIIARMGGDEFIVLLPQTDDKKAEKIVQRINENLHQMKVGSIILSISFGWQTKFRPEELIDVIFKQAEDRMYRRKLSESSSMRSSTISVIMSTLYEKNEYEQLHAQRVSDLCGVMGRALELDEDSIAELQTLGLMHDIGKIAIDENILNKPDSLSSAEWVEIRRHSEAGYRILRSVNEFSTLAEFVLDHHERWDGTGYPNGLKGEQIPLKARIITFAEAYDSMASDHPYRKSMSKEEIHSELRKNAGTQFDMSLVKVFVEKVLKLTW